MADDVTEPPMQIQRIPWSFGAVALAVAAVAIGPLTAVLRERQMLAVPGDYGDLIVVVVLALGAAAVGGITAFRGPRGVGVVGLVVNLGVALLYGFLGVFFAAGGSR
jgi:hypothetical protein